MNNSFIQFVLLFTLLLSNSALALTDTLKENYIDVDKGKIYVRTEGSGHPLVFVNGGPGAGHTVFLGWFDFLKQQGYQLVFFDDIGRGRSTRDITGKFTPQMTVDDIESVRQHLNQSQITLVGHSYGGIPAMQYALQYPEHTSKLVMLNASYDTQSQQMNANHYFHLLRTLYPEKWRVLEDLHDRGVKASDEEYDQQLFSGFMNWYQWFDVENRQYLRKSPSTDKRDRFNLQVFMDIIDLAHGGKIQGTLQNTDISKKVLNFDIPTLITAGRFDNASTPELVYRLYKMLPKAKTTFVMFEKSGHWPWVEETESFESAVSNFLAKH